MVNKIFLHFNFYCRNCSFQAVVKERKNFRFSFFFHWGRSSKESSLFENTVAGDRRSFWALIINSEGYSESEKYITRQKWAEMLPQGALSKQWKKVSFHVLLKSNELVAFRSRTSEIHAPASRWSFTSWSQEIVADLFFHFKTCGET